MSLRLRLTLTYGVLIALIMSVFSAVLYGTLRFNLESEVDRRLELRAAEVESTIRQSAGPLGLGDLTSARLDLAREDLRAPGLYVQVADATGRPLASSDNLHGTVLPVPPEALAGQRSFSDLHLAEGNHLRILSVPIGVEQRTVGILSVGQSLQPLEETLNDLTQLLLAIGGGGLFVATVVGWFVARQGLKPLTEMVSRATAIARARDFSQRLHIRGRRNEVTRLARTIDLLLATVEDTLRQHREFLADTSHELRNPLLAIRTNLELLDRMTDPEDRAECVREALQQIDRMSRLVSELLALARVERGQLIEPRPVALAPLVESMARRASHRREGPRIEIGRLDRAEVMGDEDRLAQVISNLVDNAVAHTRPEGTVTLGVERDDGWARLIVADTGEGIPPEHLPHVFERFYRVERGAGGRSGTGLGLAIVKHLAEAHGGHVTAESEVAKGTRFTVWLPCEGTG